MNQSTEILILILLIFTAAIISAACLKEKEPAEPTYSNEALPDPILTENSVELCLNSRVSYHDGYKGRASDHWLSNVLWAAGSAPITGDYRDIYVTTPSGRYLYDPDTRSFSNRTSGSSGKAAFILNYDRELDFDAGTSYMFALLESVSLWNGIRSQLASCPMQESLYFGVRDVAGLTDELAVRSSDGSLPEPKTCGNNSLEDVIANLKYTDNFTGRPVTDTVGRIRVHTPHNL
jgi:hypothetical protein